MSRVTLCVASIGGDAAQIVAGSVGKPMRQPRLLSSQEELGANSGEGVALEDAVQLAFLQRGAYNGALLLEGCDRLDPAADNAFNVGKPPRGNCASAVRAMSSGRSVASMCRAIELSALWQKQWARTTGAARRCPQFASTSGASALAA